MNIKAFFDNDTFTFTYVVSDQGTKQCAVIDPVLNIDLASGRTSTQSVDIVEQYINDQGLNLEWILETHAHADHLSGAQLIKQRLGGKIAIGEHIADVIAYWSPIFNHPVGEIAFDHLLKDGDSINIGNLDVVIMHTPGHTPACVSYLIEDCVFTGDTIFMPHLGTARADFPGGSAETLYDSIQKILALPDSTKIFVGHDYPEANCKENFMVTVKEQKEHNKMINAKVTKAEFLAGRKARDLSLPPPKLLLPSIQVNMHAGKLPEAEDNQVQYLKIPLKQL